jgi:AAA domain-containing protein
MTRKVTLVCGPPCAGKTTWVADHAKPGDTVLDIDVLAKLCGSNREHVHEGRHYRAAQAEFDQLCDVVFASTATAWVIRGAPEADKRRALADRINATRVVVLLPSENVLHARALQRDDAEPETAGDTLRAITRWHRRYTPARGDVLLTHF